MSPDHNELLFARPATGMRLWAYTLWTGSTRKLGDSEAYRARWSPDEKQIVATDNEELKLRAEDGTWRKLCHEGTYGCVRWDPSGKDLLIAVPGRRGGPTKLWCGKTEG